MKKLSFLLFISLLVLIIFSCRDDYNYDPASKPLRFSKDTVMLDTVFSTVRSETYVLKVYNQQNDDVVIPGIYLEKGSFSQFKINVDGFEGNSSNANNFQNIPLRSKDSLYIFIEIAPKGISTSEALADEDLIFNTIGNTQKVKLLSLIEDAEFYFSKSGTKEISHDLFWNSSKSKVIYGTLKLTNNANLSVSEGTKIYLHKNASILIDSGSVLTLNGSLHKEVIIRGDRHESRYDSLPGNWNQIRLARNSLAKVNHTVIKGGNNAFYLEDNAQLIISNSKIYNFLYGGIYSIGGNVEGKNLALNNCGTSDLIALYGGNYDFTHCTFANYWNLNAGAGYAVYLSNSHQKSGKLQYKQLNASFKNCILWVNNYNSLYIDNNPNAPFLYSFDTNLIKNNSNSIHVDTDNNFIHTILNKDPLFYKTGYSECLLSLTEDSPALGKGNLTYALSVPLDINGFPRTSAPALGAYQE